MANVFFREPAEAALTAAWSGRRVLVLGLGDSGFALARFLAAHGAAVRAWDSRSAPPKAALLAEACPSVERLSGALQPEALVGELDMVLKSPGLAPHDPAIAPLLQAARAAGLRVGGELDVFAAALASLREAIGYAPRVLAITGTNGKTTTTAMTAAMVERAGLQVAVAGNIGPTLLDTLTAAIGKLDPAPQAEESAVPPAADEATEAGADVVDAPATAPATAEAAEPLVPAEAPPEPDHPKLPEAWVLELSSFQLDGAEGFEPDAAAVLNLSQDHLDWHGDMAAYTAAKHRIHGRTRDWARTVAEAEDDAGFPRTVMVVNADDPAVEAMVPPAATRKGGRGQRARVLPPPVVRFGLGVPTQHGDFGLIEQRGVTWLARALPLDESLSPAEREAEPLHLNLLMPVEALRVRGRHNAANALAALALGSSIGCALAPMLHALRDYRGEPHRVEWVATVQGVAAYDDSKGTNVGATVAALEGLGAEIAPARLVVILGGDGKGQDFAPLAGPVARHVRAVALIGRDAGAIREALAQHGAGDVPTEDQPTLEAAVTWGFAQAQAGDALLLSPACASLDMFRHYAHRAEVFVAAVREHALACGDIA